MKASSVLLAVGLFIAGSAVAKATDAPSTAGDGKQIFLAQGCNTCHAVSSAAIEPKLKSSKAPDLTDVGAKRDAASITKYLKKETTLNDKKHPSPKTISASDAELTTLVNWLGEQKTSGKK